MKVILAVGEIFKKCNTLGLMVIASCCLQQHDLWRQISVKFFVYVQCMLIDKIGNITVVKKSLLCSLSRLNYLPVLSPGQCTVRPSSNHGLYLITFSTVQKGRLESLIIQKDYTRSQITDHRICKDTLSALWRGRMETVRLNEKASWIHPHAWTTPLETLEVGQHGWVPLNFFKKYIWSFIVIYPKCKV